MHNEMNPRKCVSFFLWVVEINNFFPVPIFRTMAVVPHMMDRGDRKGGHYHYDDLLIRIIINNFQRIRLRTHTHIAHITLWSFVVSRRIFCLLECDHTNNTNKGNCNFIDSLPLIYLQLIGLFLFDSGLILRFDSWKSTVKLNYQHMICALSINRQSFSKFSKNQHTIFSLCTPKIANFPQILKRTDRNRKIQIPLYDNFNALPRIRVILSASFERHIWTDEN